ncbi:hypothetical protein IFM89_004994 [Coptis chinensis]|uniref:DUF4283 domain-containing protein n=1 Tax=Coptis chinensis TaxID=261450 RepID=A0A835HGG1_9MAGN|nr:hypothetical protein IFM89_004994 [Coptis chinensis]
MMADKNLFYFKFVNDEDKQRVIDHEPRSFLGRIFVVRPWTPSIDKYRNGIKALPIWIRVDLPKHLWTKNEEVGQTQERTYREVTEALEPTVRGSQVVVHSEEDKFEEVRTEFEPSKVGSLNTEGEEGNSEDSKEKKVYSIKRGEIRQEDSYSTGWHKAKRKSRNKAKGAAKVRKDNNEEKEENAIGESINAIASTQHMRKSNRAGAEKGTKSGSGIQPQLS